MPTQVASLQVGEIGIEIVLATGFDLSTLAAPTAELHHLKPNGVEGVFVGIIKSPSSDGKIAYTTTAAADLDVRGDWVFQAVIKDGSAELVGEAALFRVKARFER